MLCYCSAQAGCPADFLLRQMFVSGRRQLRFLVEHDHRLAHLIGAHLIIAFRQAVQALRTDYPVGALGLIRDEGDTVFEIFLIQFRIVQFLIIRVEEIDIISFDPGQKHIMADIQKEPQQYGPAEVLHRTEIHRQRESSSPVRTG